MAKLEVLDLPLIERNTPAYDAAVLQTAGAMKVCSSAAWQIAAHRAFGGDRQVFICRLDEHWGAFAVRLAGNHRFALEPLECVWGFGCSLVGPTADGSIALLQEIAALFGDSLYALRICGLPKDLELHLRLLAGALPGFDSLAFEGQACDCADLSEGSESYLARRDPAFRSNLRRLSRRCAEATVAFEVFGPGCDVAEVFARLVKVELQSWKHRDGAGFMNWSGGETFYRGLAIDLAKHDRLRAIFATREGCDLAYAFGGVLGTEYRGFQIAYDDQFASLGLGHMVQWELMQRLAAEGIKTYDLGMRMDYKSRWRDFPAEICDVILRRSSAK